LLHAEVEGESLSLLDYYETTTAIVKPNNDSDVRILVCKNQVQEKKIYEEWLVVVHHDGGGSLIRSRLWTMRG
jgi:hypothetical protein